MRKPNCALNSSNNSRSSAAGSLARNSFAFILTTYLSYNECSLDRQLCGSQAKGLTRQDFVDAIHFIQHLSGLNFGDKVLRIAFTISHPHLCRFVGNRLVRKDPYPDTTAPLDVAAHCATCSFYLARS